MTSLTPVIQSSWPASWPNETIPLVHDSYNNPFNWFPIQFLDFIHAHNLFLLRIYLCLVYLRIPLILHVNCLFSTLLLFLFFTVFHHSFFFLCCSIWFMHGCILLTWNYLDEIGFFPPQSYLGTAEYQSGLHTLLPLETVFQLQQNIVDIVTLPWSSLLNWMTCRVKFAWTAYQFILKI